MIYRVVDCNINESSAGLKQDVFDCSEYTLVRIIENNVNQTRGAIFSMFSEGSLNIMSPIFAESAAGSPFPKIKQILKTHRIDLCTTGNRPKIERGIVALKSV